MRTSPDFDRIARLYRWMEYASVGPVLERCRYYHLARLSGCRRALILGDGDGRFTARLLAMNRTVTVDAVDQSRSMLALLKSRCGFASERLRTYQGDALSFTLESSPDCIISHFFLDCLRQEQVDALVEQFASSLAAGGVWLISEFRVPSGVLHWPARLYIRALYFAFRILTGLRVTRLPEYGRAFETAGLVPISIHHSLLGLLTTEVWQRPVPQDSL